MSEEINISNYEVYAMDYIDGTLSEELTTSFDAFLILNPEIAVEIDELRNVDKLESSIAPAFDKNALKINFTGAISDDNYEDYLIAAVEGELNDIEEKEVQQFVASNPAIEKDYRLFQKTMLRPNKDVVFPSKSSLKKPIPLWQNTTQIIYRAAAVLLIALGSTTIWNVINKEKYIPRNGVEDFTAIESMIQQRTKPASIAHEKQYVEKIALQENSVSKQSAFEREPSLEQMSTLNPEVSFGDAEVKKRAPISYQPQISEWISEEK